jgi:hypothetical protein
LHGVNIDGRGAFGEIVGRIEFAIHLVEMTRFPSLMNKEKTQIDVPNMLGKSTRLARSLPPMGPSDQAMHISLSESAIRRRTVPSNTGVSAV